MTTLTFWIVAGLILCLFFECLSLRTELKSASDRVDRLEKQVESMDEMKATNKYPPALPQIKGFNPAKPKTVLPGEGGAREVQEGAQVFEFDVKN
jgi:hypothetical protein